MTYRTAVINWGSQYVTVMCNGSDLVEIVSPFTVNLNRTQGGPRRYFVLLQLVYFEPKFLYPTCVLGITESKRERDSLVQVLDLC